MDEDDDEKWEIVIFQMTKKQENRKRKSNEILNDREWRGETRSVRRRKSEWRGRLDDLRFKRMTNFQSSFVVEMYKYTLNIYVVAAKLVHWVWSMPVLRWRHSIYSFSFCHFFGRYAQIQSMLNLFLFRFLRDKLIDKRTKVSFFHFSFSFLFSFSLSVSQNHLLYVWLFLCINDGEKLPVQCQIYHVEFCFSYFFCFVSLVISSDIYTSHIERDNTFTYIAINLQLHTYINMYIIFFPKIVLTVIRKQKNT